MRRELVKAFLKPDRFVITSPNAYNQLGLGTTQLYNKELSTIKNGMERFRSAIEGSFLSVDLMFQKQLSPEFLLVDLVNELEPTAVGSDAVLSRGSRKSQRDGPEKTFTGSFSLRQVLHAKKFQRCCNMPLNLFLHERNDFKALVENRCRQRENP